MSWAISNLHLYFAVFLSGFSALVYQLIWARVLGLEFGVSSFAVATVVAVFLLGLGFGSLFFGKLSDKSENPLKTYAHVELAIALLSVLSYLLIQHLPLYRLAYEYSYNHLDFYGLSLVRFLLSTLVLFPPVFAIGGTIPLIAKYFLTHPATLGSDFSRVYYLNTLGAFVGSMGTGFVLVKYLGVFDTFLIAVCANLTIALTIYARKTRKKQQADSSGEMPPYSYMLPVLFVTGFVGLSYEILWTRILSTHDLATSQAFALIVSGFLLGYAVGSLIITSKIDSLKSLENSFGLASILTAVSGAAVLPTLQRFEALTTRLSEITGMASISTAMALGFVLSLIPAIFMGVLFPLGLRIYFGDIDRIGKKAGTILFVNTMGCVAGSFVTGFAFIPFIGMWNTTIILVNSSLAIAAYIFVFRTDFDRKRVAIVLIIFAAANSLVFSEKKTFHKTIDGFDVIYYEEGLSGTITAVQRRGYRGLFVDGQNVSGTDSVLMADSKMLAHLPLLLAQDPKRALTVGYGTGATSYSMLLHGVKVNAVEIERKIVEAGPLFEQVNFHSYTDQNLEIVLDDARNYINLAPEPFDVIATDVTNLKYKRNPYLYTKEYFQIMKNALSDEGVAAAWLPLGGLSFRDLKILIHTFDEVFPHTTVWFFTPYPTHFLIIVGTPESTKVDLTRLASGMQNVKTDLRRIQVDDVNELASMLLLGERDVDAMVTGEATHTDNYPILEFSDVDDYFQVDVAPNLKKLLEYQKEELGRYFVASPAQREELEEQFQINFNRYKSYIRVYERQTQGSTGT